MSLRQLFYYFFLFFFSKKNKEKRQKDKFLINYNLILTLYSKKLNINKPDASTKNSKKNIEKYYKKTEMDNEHFLFHIKQHAYSSKEWYNSIYAYNKNTLNLLPVADKIIINLIKSYFNLYSKILNYRIRYRSLRTKIRRKSSHRIYVSKAEFSHIINKLIITIYIYNRQKYNFFNKIKKKIIRKRYIGVLKKNIFKRKIRLIKRKGLKILRKVSNEKQMLIETMTLPTIANDVNETQKLEIATENYEILYYKNFIKKCLKREMLYIYYKQILYFNKSKFDNTYLDKLSNLIRKIYNKKIEFNIVSLKYFYLNSDIFSESLAIKLRIRKNRLLNVLKRSLRKVKIAKFSKYGEGNLHLPKIINAFRNLNNDPLNRLLYKLYFANNERVFLNRPEKHLEKYVLNSFNHKAITGVRLEAAGRLSRRITASRSVFKVKYKGSLKNIDSSYKGLPTPILRGNLKTNLQYSVMHSKTRIGAFGLKGWVSSN